MALPILKVFGVMVAISFIAGCSNSVPKCGSEDAMALVKQIADEEMTGQLGKEIADLFSYSVNAIRTTRQDEGTGAYQCAAQLGIIAKDTGNENEIAITYKIEKTDNGKEFYITVFGL